MDYSETSKVFKAYCDENRLAILDHLRDGEKCACNLLELLEISQSTLSHHMKILVEGGAVVARREGKWTHYSLSCEGITTAVDVLKTFCADGAKDSGGCVCATAPRGER